MQVHKRYFSLFPIKIMNLIGPRSHSEVLREEIA